MSLTERYMKLEMIIAESKLELMRSLVTDFKFMQMYFLELETCKNEELAFSIVNLRYLSLFKIKRFESFLDFKNFLLKRNIVDSKEKRIALLNWFKSKGFTTFESFKPVIQFFYPEVSTAGLLAFWNNDYIDAKVLERVNHTYQILF